MKIEMLALGVAVGAAVTAVSSMVSHAANRDMWLTHYDESHKQTLSRDKYPSPRTVGGHWAFVIAVFALLAMLFGCAPPPVSELLKDGINCRAAITMPEEMRAREGDVVDVKVRIYDCK